MRGHISSEDDDIIIPDLIIEDIEVYLSLLFIVHNNIINCTVSCFLLYILLL